MRIAHENSEQYCDLRVQFLVDTLEEIVSGSNETYNAIEAPAFPRHDHDGQLTLLIANVGEDVGTMRGTSCNN